jgi:nucleotide-binding universal stress UspA family protein
MHYTTVVRSGPPNEVLSRECEVVGADALAVGRVRRSALEEWILGSTTRSLLKSMPTTLLLTPFEE